MSDDTQVVAVEGVRVPVQQITLPPYLEHTMVGVMVAVGLAAIGLLLRRFMGKNSADATIDARNDALQVRLMKALDDSQQEKSEIVARAQRKEDELYGRNKELNDRNAAMTDKIISITQTHATELLASQTQMRTEMAAQSQKHDDAMKRVFTEFAATKEILARCEERDRVRAESEAKMEHRLEAMERIIGVKAAIGETIIPKS